MNITSCIPPLASIKEGFTVVVNIELKFPI